MVGERLHVARGKAPQHFGRHEAGALAQPTEEFIEGFERPRIGLGRHVLLEPHRAARDAAGIGEGHEHELGMVLGRRPGIEPRASAASRFALSQRCSEVVPAFGMPMWRMSFGRLRAAGATAGTSRGALAGTPFAMRTARTRGANDGISNGC